MLAYAFRVLQKTNYQKLATEDFDGIEDLLAEIVTIGVSEQLKRGLYKEYILVNEELKVLRGRLDLNKTIRSLARNERQTLWCEHDELSVNNIYNQILKSTMLSLLGNHRLTNRNVRKTLRNLLGYFNDVNTINLADVKWKQLRFHKNNQTYRMLLNICNLIYDEVLMRDEKGERHLQAFTDERMHRLYEEFILQYYKRFYSELESKVTIMKWHKDTDFKNHGYNALPDMKTDITLEDKKSGRVLIIDAKYYPEMWQKSEYSEQPKLHSGHVYQIFAYVKNFAAMRQEKNPQTNVSGMILYAKSDDDVAPDTDVSICGSRIAAKALDLSGDFEEIEAQLDAIKAEYFG